MGGASLVTSQPCSSYLYHTHLQLDFPVQETTKVYEPLSPQALVIALLSHPSQNSPHRHTSPSQPSGIQTAPFLNPTLPRSTSYSRLHQAYRGLHHNRSHGRRRRSNFDSGDELGEVFEKKLMFDKEDVLCEMLSLVKRAYDRWSEGGAVEEVWYVRAAEGDDEMGGIDAASKGKL